MLPKQPKRTAILILVTALMTVAVLVTTLLFFRGDRSTTANGANTNQTPQPKSFDPLLPKHAKPKKEEPVVQPSPSVPQTREELLVAIDNAFESDDVCALETLSKSYEQSLSPDERRQPDRKITSRFLFNSPFQKRYLEYETGLKGKGDLTSFYSRFLSALVKAKWISNDAGEVRRTPSAADRRRAFYDMLNLAHEDAGNAAPAAFALAMAFEMSKDQIAPGTPHREEEIAGLVRLIEEAKRFDSYTLAYLREMVATEDDRAISLLLRIGHLAGLAIPDWTKFRNGIEAATIQQTSLRLKLTDLMMSEAKEAKRPSWTLSYNVLETSIARAIAGPGRAYPSFKDIDLEFSISGKPDSDRFYTMVQQAAEKGCTPAYAAELRDYLLYLKKNDFALGVAM